MQNKKYDSYGFRMKPKKSILGSDTKNNNNSNPNYSIIGLVLTFIILMVICILMLISGYVSWYCYANDLPSIRILKTILASVFFYFYLPYFGFIRVILKMPCL